MSAMYSIPAHAEYVGQATTAGKPGGKVSSQSHTNYRYLSSPDKVERLRKLHQLYRKTSKQLHHLKLRLANAIEQQGVNLGSSLDDDLHSIMVSL